MENCLFCKILKREIPADKVFENDNVIGFVDINPQAPTHLLFIHKNHSSDFNDITHNDPKALVQVCEAISEHTEKTGLKEAGYRVVTNIGETAGQSVFHTHFHILSAPRLGRFGS